MKFLQHSYKLTKSYSSFNPLNAQLNPICHLLALLGAHHIFHVSGLGVNLFREFGIMLKNSMKPALVDRT